MNKSYNVTSKKLSSTTLIWLIPITLLFILFLRYNIQKTGHFLSNPLNLFCSCVRAMRRRKGRLLMLGKLSVCPRVRLLVKTFGFTRSQYQWSQRFLVLTFHKLTPQPGESWRPIVSLNDFPAVHFQVSPVSQDSQAEVVVAGAGTQLMIELMKLGRRLNNNHTLPGGLETSAANRLIGEVVQSRRRPLLGPSPGWKRPLALSHLRHYAKQALTFSPLPPLFHCNIFWHTSG